MFRPVNVQTQHNTTQHTTHTHNTRTKKKKEMFGRRQRRGAALELRRHLQVQQEQEVAREEAARLEKIKAAKEEEEKKTKGETNNADEDEEDDLEPDLFVIGYGCTIHKDTKLHEATNSTSLLQAWNEDNSLLMDRYHAPFQAFLVHLRCFLLLHF